MHPRAAVAVTVLRRSVLPKAGGWEVLLIRRGAPPGQFMWAPPGGKVMLGEAARAAAERELAEEVPDARATFCSDDAVITTDAISRDPDSGAVTHHYVIAHFAAVARAGEEGGAAGSSAVAASDAVEAAWVPAGELAGVQGLVPLFPKVLARVLPVVEAWEREAER